MEEYEVIQEINSNEISDHVSGEENYEEYSDEIEEAASYPQEENEVISVVPTTDLSVDSYILDNSIDSAASSSSSVDMNDLLNILNEVVHNNILASKASSEASSQGSSEGSSEGGSESGSEVSSTVEIIDYSGYLDSISGQLDMALEFASTYQSNYLTEQNNNTLDSKVDDIGLTNTLMLMLIIIGLSSMCVHFARGLF